MTFKQWYDRWFMRTERWPTLQQAYSAGRRSVKLNWEALQDVCVFWSGIEVCRYHGKPTKCSKRTCPVWAQIAGRRCGASGTR